MTLFVRRASAYIFHQDPKTLCNGRFRANLSKTIDLKCVKMCMKRRSMFAILRWQITTRFTNLNGFFSPSNKIIFTPQNIYKPEKSLAPEHQDLLATSGFDAPIQLVEDDTTTPGAGCGFCWKKIHKWNPRMEVVAFSKKDGSTCESDIKTIVAYAIHQGDSLLCKNDSKCRKWYISI